MSEGVNLAPNNYIHGFSLIIVILTNASLQCFFHKLQCIFYLEIDRNDTQKWKEKNSFFYETLFL